MAYLPSEILFHHIFVRLPVNSVLRFKCVCQAWNRMLNHPQFPRMHLAQYQSSEILLLSNEFDCFFSTALNLYSLDYEPSSEGAVDAVKLHYSPLNNSKKIPPSRIVGRCNGLLLLCSSEVQDRDLILWNPSISDSKVIRAPNSSLIDFHLLGFGCDSSTDDYKIVRIINGTGTNHHFMVFNHQKECQVDIYSLKTDSWKTIEHDAPRLFIGRHSDREGCAVHGSIYWLQCSPYRGIFGFDLKDNKFRELQSLPNDLSPWHDASLKALGESLAIYQYDIGIGNNKLVAWTTKAGKKEEWIKLMTLYIYPDPHELTTRTRPVSLMKNGKVLVHLLQVLLPAHKIQNKFVLYDPKRDSVEDFHIRGISVRWVSLITYIESLISPNFSREGY